MTSYRKVPYLNDYVYIFYDWIIENKHLGSPSERSNIIKIIKAQASKLHKEEPDKILTVNDIGIYFKDTKKAYIYSLVQDFFIYITANRETSWLIHLEFKARPADKIIVTKTFLEAYDTAFYDVQYERAPHPQVACNWASYKNLDLGIEGQLPYREALSNNALLKYMKERDEKEGYDRYGFG